MAAIVVTMLAPAAAWAESTGVAEALRRRPRGFGFGGFFGGLCCLVVVGIIVVIVLLVMRNRNRPSQ